MKKVLILCLAAAAAVAVTPVTAGVPTFKSFSGAGNATTPTTVIVPADPNLQFRVLSINYASDTNNGGLLFSKGAGAYYATITNATTGAGGTTATTNNISATNGLVTSSVMVLQQNGSCYSSTLSSWGGTNGTYFIVLASGGWGVAQAVNADIYQMSAATSPYVVGASTNWLNGEALYVGDQGRPVIAKLTPALATNQIISLTGQYQ